MQAAAFAPMWLSVKPMCALMYAKLGTFGGVDHQPLTNPPHPAIEL